MDPTAADPDDEPNNGGPFWDGWTIRDANIEGNLPGADFHPLETEITGGTLTPAGTEDCASKGNGGMEAGNNVSIFGESFPVCVITDGDLDGDYTLTNDHANILDGTVQVGNGDVEGAHDAGTVRDDILTIEEGTRIFGVSDTDPSLVITRGSEINAVGTPDPPIIFGATPKTSPVIANITILGDAGNGGAADQNTMGALHREGFGGQVYRGVYADNSVAGTQFDSGCLDVDDELDEDLAYEDVIFNCNVGSLVNDSD